MKILLFTFYILTFYHFAMTQSQYEDISFEDYTYVTNIKSVTFHPNGDFLDPPITFLNNSQKLVLMFDDLDNIVKDYTYDIIHCNKDWTVSELEKLEYIDGFLDEEIDDSNFSTNTLVPYISYRLTLPNEDLQWTLSGNYLLVIYEGNVIDDRLPVISRRFMVVDKKVNIFVENRRPLNVSKLRTHHEFDLFVNNKDFKIIDPRTNLSITILQNYRWDTGISGLFPRFIVGDQMTIDNTGKISFYANKEFRPLDIRSFDYVSHGINSIDLKEYGTDIIVDLGKPRRNSYYTTIPDANGQFVIQNKDQGSDRLEGDYANVIFTLLSPELDEEVYVMGKLSDWKPDEMYRMRYYEARETYVAEVLLKQGFYDYYYGVDINGLLQSQSIEGSWADTENNYQVFVYLREPGDVYDRLIGYYSFNSNRF